MITKAYKASWTEDKKKIYVKLDNVREENKFQISFTKKPSKEEMNKLKDEQKPKNRIAENKKKIGNEESLHLV